MTEAQKELVNRLRALLANEPVQREVMMFGGRAFIIHEKMIVSAQKDGGLLVRVAPERHESLLSRPGSSQAEMGAGRSMGSGWIDVGNTVLDDDGELSFWLGEAMEFNLVARGVADG